MRYIFYFRHPGNFMLASLMSLIFQLIFVEEGNLNVFLMLGMMFVAQKHFRKHQWKIRYSLP
ncbi:MAG: hypothetical protein DRR08_00020 [Candidatus Parabeggiatoa sp. nov. 2]|nr:MAG: hypothetical protein B6247_21375 [Beggiatoa sp. 4572_84]RKZ64579.1 MAG: hypothetical protein DRR08_00020 [Gammaproteobacteria bacterium]